VHMLLLQDRFALYHASGRGVRWPPVGDITYGLMCCNRGHLIPLVSTKVRCSGQNLRGAKVSFPFITVSH
jgi:hypothetical protein